MAALPGEVGVLQRASTEERLNMAVERDLSQTPPHCCYQLQAFKLVILSIFPSLEHSWKASIVDSVQQKRGLRQNQGLPKMISWFMDGVGFK